jgi:hypothetical protein
MAPGFVIMATLPGPGGGVGSGKLIRDPWTDESYEDTDPGIGDGRPRTRPDNDRVSR